MPAHLRNILQTQYRMKPNTKPGAYTSQSSKPYLSSDIELTNPYQKPILNPIRARRHKMWKKTRFIT